MKTGAAFDSKAIKIPSLKELLRVMLQQRESGLFILLVIIFVALSIAKPDTFFTSDNLFNILKQVSLVSIIAVGQTFVMVSGGIDLSVGFSLGLSGVIFAYFAKLGMDPYMAFACGLSTGVLLGFCNGLLITKLRLPPFIVTLGMAKIARGIMYVLTRGYSIPTREQFILTLGNGYIGPVPIPTIVLLMVVAFGTYLLSRTVFGNRVKAIGGNELAARLSGINVSKNKILVYSLTGLFCSIAGLIMVGRVNAGNPNSGLNFDLDSIAATIIGGTSLAGGEGTVIGTLLGALLLGVIRNGLVLLNVSMYWQTVVAGAIIIIVCGLDALTHRKEK